MNILSWMHVSKSLVVVEREGALLHDIVRLSRQRNERLDVTGLRSALQGPPTRPARLARRLALGALLSLCFCDLALGKDKAEDDDETAKPKPTLPNFYLDMRTNYNTLPAGTLSIGFSAPPLLSTLSNLSSLGTLTSPASRSASVDLPLTVDVTDRLSVYGGVSGATSQSGTAPWSSFDIYGFTIGFQADLYQQNGGMFPTLTIQSNASRSIPAAPLATTTYNTILNSDTKTAGDYYPGDNDWTTGSGGITDTGDTGNAVSSYSALPVGPNLGCSNGVVLPLTLSKATVKSSISGLTASSGGSTVLSQGLQWAWFTLSPVWQGYWGLAASPVGLSRPLAYGTIGNFKVVILMTDGNDEWDGNEETSQNANCGNKTVVPECGQADGY